MPGVRILQPLFDKSPRVLQHPNQLLWRQTDEDPIGLFIDNLKQRAVEVGRVCNLVPVTACRPARNGRCGSQRSNPVLLLVGPVPPVVLNPIRLRQGRHLQPGREASQHRQPACRGLCRRRCRRLACSHDGEGTSNCEVHAYTRN